MHFACFSIFFQIKVAVKLNLFTKHAFAVVRCCYYWWRRCGPLMRQDPRRGTRQRLSMGPPLLVGFLMACTTLPPRIKRSRHSLLMYGLRSGTCGEMPAAWRELRGERWPETRSILLSFTSARGATTTFSAQPAL